MLLDSNIVIYSAEAAHAHLRKYVKDKKNVVSAISQLEVLGYHSLTAPDRKYFEAVFQYMTVLPVSQLIIDEATLLRQQHRLSLGDSIVAATALLHNHDVVTRNTKDFNRIAVLKHLNPIDTTS